MCEFVVNELMSTDLKTSLTGWMEENKEVNQVEWEQLIKSITTEEVKRKKPDAISSSVFYRLNQRIRYKGGFFVDPNLLALY